VEVAVRYSRGGLELVWCDRLELDGLGEGPQEAEKLKNSFLADLKKDQGRSTSRSREIAIEPRVQLRVVPIRPGHSPQKLVAPQSGQGLFSFLEQYCREDNGVFQLRAVFERPISPDFVHITVSLPSALPPIDVGSGSSSSSSSHQWHTLTPNGGEEQFEFKKNSTVRELKRHLQARIRLPTQSSILVKNRIRLPDEVPIGLLTLGNDSEPLDLHLATSGSFLLLRREGQGHRAVRGQHRLHLTVLDRPVGTNEQIVSFDLHQTLSELLWAIQAHTGLSPAGMKLTLALSETEHRTYTTSEGSETLQELGFFDGCHTSIERCIQQETCNNDLFDQPLEAPAAGSASALYSLASASLGFKDPSCLALYDGHRCISSDGDLSQLSLVDGTVLSAFVHREFSLPVSLWKVVASDEVGEYSFSSGSSSSEGSEQIQVFSTDSVKAVQERAITSAEAANKRQLASALRESWVFGVSPETWQAATSGKRTLCDLVRKMHHFVPLRPNARLCQLGILDPEGESARVNFIFVPQRLLRVEVEVHGSGGEVRHEKITLKCTSQVRQATKMLWQALQKKIPPTRHGAVPQIETNGMQCSWSIRRPDSDIAADMQALRQVSHQEPLTPTPATPPSEAPTSSCSSQQPSALSAALSGISTAVQNGKRRLSGSFGRQKRQRTEEIPSISIADDIFLGDLCTLFPAERAPYPTEFTCPISREIMQDPVTANSGHTYDRASIMHWFATQRTPPRDPISNRPLTNKTLIENHSIRGLIASYQAAQVDLKLVATLSEAPKEQRRRSVEGRKLGFHSKTVDDDETSRISVVNDSDTHTSPSWFRSFLPWKSKGIERA